MTKSRSEYSSKPPWIYEPAASSAVSRGSAATAAWDCFQELAVEGAVQEAWCCPKGPPEYRLRLGLALWIGKERGCHTKGMLRVPFGSGCADTFWLTAPLSQKQTF